MLGHRFPLHGLMMVMMMVIVEHRGSRSLRRGDRTGMATGYLRGVAKVRAARAVAAGSRGGLFEQRSRKGWRAPEAEWMDELVGN